MSAATVVVTGVSGEAAQGIIKGLRRAGTSVRVVGLDYSADNAGFILSDVGIQVLPIRDPGYIDQLLETCRSHGAIALMSGIDGEQEILAPAASSFDELGTRVVISDPELVRAFSDKLLTHRWFESHGLESPATLDAGEVDPEAAADRLGLPLILKPRRGHGSQGVHRCESASQLASLMEDGVGDSCLQELVEGPEFTVSLLFDDAGLRDHLIMLRELRDGRTVRARVVKHPRISAFVARFAESASGAFASMNLQLRVDEEGRVMVFEVNPRFSGSTALRVAAGYNEPARVIDYLVDGHPMTPDEPRIGATIYRVWSELLVEEGS